MTTPAPDQQASHDSSVDGMNVFWILFQLTSAIALHPLGTAPGYSHDIAFYIRTLPLCSLIDVVQLYFDWITRWRTGHGQASRWRAAVRDIATQRLRQGLQPGPEAGAGNDGFHARLTRFLLRPVPRLLANIAVVLAYTRIWGMTGIPWSQAIATVCFGIWVSLELALVTALGLRPRVPSGPDDLDAPDDTAALPPPHAPSRGVEEWALLSGVLACGQAIALFGGLLFLLWRLLSPVFGTVALKWLDISAIPVGTWYSAIINFIASGAGLEIKPGGWILPVDESQGGDYSFGQEMYLAVILMPACMFFFTLTGCISLVVLLLPLPIPLGVVALALFMLRSLSSSLLVHLLAEDGIRWRQRLAAWASVCCLWGFCLVFYNVTWDKAGTSKADWTEKIA